MIASLLSWFISGVAISRRATIVALSRSLHRSRSTFAVRRLNFTMGHAQLVFRQDKPSIANIILEDHRIRS
ncbi:hypothetical protein GGS20DRAFT_549040 [Poronia punctata]|nr:hypothetical protein GGS20DRAFT_549040 [Poronia punctata]